MCCQFSRQILGRMAPLLLQDCWKQMRGLARPPYRWAVGMAFVRRSRRWSAGVGIRGADDLAGIDPLKIRTGGPQIGITELAWMMFATTPSRAKLSAWARRS